MLNMILNLAKDYHVINNIVVAIIVIAVALGIAYGTNLVNIKIILLLISLVLILLYAFGILGQIWAASGFILFALLLYGIFNQQQKMVVING